MSKFTFDLGQKVKIEESGETGKVISRAEHDHAENIYQIRYKAADGRAVESWWMESALAAEPSSA